MRRRIIASGFGVMLIVGFVSCKDEGEAPSHCGDCADNGGYLFMCYGGLLSSAGKYKGTVCVSPEENNSVDISYACQTTYGGPFWNVNFYEPVPCDETAVGATETDGRSGCDDWDPGVAIAQTANGYEIDKDFVSYIVEDPTRLANCDSGTVEFDVNSGAFLVQNASSGTLLYELGFRNGDIFEEVNGYPLESIDEAADAVGDLYYENGETEYTFTVKRGQSNLGISIEIVSS